MVSTAGNPGEVWRDFSDKPLPSPESLAMFETVRQAKGNDIRVKVYTLFRANVFDAFDAAAVAIGAEGPQAKDSSMR
jgi:hypothetical protein